MKTMKMHHSLQWLALLNIVILAVAQEMNLLNCDGNPKMHRCGDNLKCVLETKLCDYEVDCDDYSDENFTMCKEIQQKGKCSNGQVYDDNRRGCETISKVCFTEYQPQSDYSYRSHQPNPPIKPKPLFCGEIKNGLKSMDVVLDVMIPLKKENQVLKAALNATLPLKHDSNLEDNFKHLATSFNETQRLANDSTGCPPFYINIHGKCVALFSVAQVTWFQAKQFCDSISGTLAMIRKLKDYETLLKQIKIQEMDTDFWIGGYVESNSANSSTWRWIDEKKIDLGGPYWSMHYSAQCTKRGTSDVCYHYSLAPQETRDGLSLAMDYDDHYYFSDHNCQELRSPLCFLNDK